MRDFTKRRGRGDTVRRFFFGIGIIAVLALITFSAVRAAWGMYGKFAEAASNNDAAQQNLVQMKEQEASVQAEVTNLSSQEGQEAQLRQSYGVALPGEGEIQIIQEAPTSTAAAAPAPDGFFTRILKALFVW